MHAKKKLFISLFAVAMATNHLASCTSGGGGGGNDNEGGASNEGGSDQGGGSGGQGGSGGKGGSGSGGVSGKGGAASGGTAQTGGSATGGTSPQGGTAQGGTAQGGAAQQGGAANTGASVAVFSGTDMNFAKLVAADAGPGYVYASSMSVAVTLDYPTVSDALLPAGVDTAIHGVFTTVAFSNVIVGFNFRPNANNLWQWFDASKYKGIEFWAKAGSTAALKINTVDGSNLPMNPSDPLEANKGLCPGATRAECEPIHSVTKIVRTSWEKFTIPFTDFTALTPIAGIDLAHLGRIDLLYQAPNANGLELWMTGIRLVETLPL